jgi:hypothetical protein
MTITLFFIVDIAREFVNKEEEEKLLRILAERRLRRRCQAEIPLPKPGMFFTKPI